uniref:Uncharacterized protein n=1 Tax=Vitrella brassicaformis TaxID=1169539 RepID=A0A7S1P230_9ALVE|mmetsp:Transcript_25183/g.62348  ORF Transcript_25183/g.62348 Transcript_25183/m.62348 type:complete len:116 (+) Transcript_25183:555-902(+)
MTCTVAHPVCGHRLPFYCLPPPFHVVLRAVEAAIHDVLGTEANDDINSVLFPQNLVMRDHMTLQRMMVRDEWRQEIEWERACVCGETNAPHEGVWCVVERDGLWSLNHRRMGGWV